MKNEQMTTNPRKQQNSLVFEVVRPQRKQLSRYKLKKQANFAEKILQDSQIFEA